MDNTSITTSYDSSFAVILRGLLDRSPMTGKRTTYKVLSEFLDVKQQSVSSWANGTTVPDTKHIAPIANYFGVTCDYLLGREQAHNHITTDICRETALAPEAVEVLRILANNVRFDNCSENEGSSLENLKLRAINHLIANCNAVLSNISLYLFGDIPSVGDVKVKGTRVTISQTGDAIRLGLLQSISTKLSNYRELLLDSGGDLPLTLSLDDARKEKKAAYVKRMSESLERIRGQPLANEEIAVFEERWEKAFSNDGEILI